MEVTIQQGSKLQQVKGGGGTAYCICLRLNLKEERDTELQNKKMSCQPEI